MTGLDADRARNCLDRHSGVFGDGGWVLHVTQDEVADLQQAKQRIQEAKVKAFGTETPGRIRLWYFALQCAASGTARCRKAAIVAAYEGYVELLDQLRTHAMRRVAVE
ncbi:hypothetical protein AB4Y45_33420 [Paraburkholderia sp. EG287A]|uniref:hypothetical protein n=1 Tax=Paraburkholderia sp. EG287A TaxID=3237012 RepID=UPI0034D1E514